MCVADFGPICGVAYIICYKNPFNPSMLKPFMKFTQSYASSTKQKQH